MYSINQSTHHYFRCVNTYVGQCLVWSSDRLWNDASRLSRGRLPSSSSNGRNGLSDEEGGTVPLSRQLDLPSWSSAGLQGPPSASLWQDPFSPPPLALNGMFLSHSLGSDADDSDDFDGLAPNGERFSSLVELQLQRAIKMTNDWSLLLKSYWSDQENRSIFREQRAYVWLWLVQVRRKHCQCAT